MTPEQRKALDALTPKRRAFVLAYVRTGNATEAAREAGYAHPHSQGPRLLGFVGETVGLLEAPAEDAKIASVDELREFWTSVARGDEPAAMKERLKATELLGKSQGAFIDRREVSGPQGAPVVIEVKTPAELVQLRQLAKMEAK